MPSTCWALGAAPSPRTWRWTPPFGATSCWTTPGSVWDSLRCSWATPSGDTWPFGRQRLSPMLALAWFCSIQWAGFAASRTERRDPGPCPGPATLLRPWGVLFSKTDSSQRLLFENLRRPGQHPPPVAEGVRGSYQRGRGTGGRPFAALPWIPVPLPCLPTSSTCLLTSRWMSGFAQGAGSAAVLLGAPRPLDQPRSTAVAVS